MSHRHLAIALPPLQLVRAGSASVSYQPNLKCPPGYLIWSSDQTAGAVDTYGYTTPFVSFNWGLYGA